ncbi:MAG: EAL domain-containing protein [Oscillospiraceae bacterium]|jgi:EAL domain-containing protein (putative c-di-GMP-specific phosphodiesterase class I)/GGDEF domain-containing protein|nr:EAL domain-containing protein [Oscillospiraceae bacterium]
MPHLLSEEPNLLFYTSLTDIPPLIVALFAAILVIAVVELYFLLRNRKEKAEFRHTKDINSYASLHHVETFADECDKIMSREFGTTFSMLQVSIRGFKHIKDIYGIAASNRTVHSLASCIHTFTKNYELMVFDDSNNFLVLIRANDAADAACFFKDISAAYLVRWEENTIAPDTLGGLYCGISISEQGKDITAIEMIERARIAAKRAADKKLEFTVYEPRFRTRLLHESEITRVMGDALRQNEFTFYLQPQHHLKHKDRVLSAEALVRWKKPDGSTLCPDEFIPIFEKNGFIVELDRYIFEKACSFLHEHEHEDWCRSLVIACNVSRLGIFKDDFLEYYVSKKKHYQIEDGQLELEFTESAVFDDIDGFRDVLISLKDAGFKTSLDDFGTGSSSLGILRLLPMDELKIDKAFFDDTPMWNERGSAVVAGITNMTQALGMKIVAEGVEKSEQVLTLRKLGCDIIQGFVFARPLSQEAFINYVSSYKGLPEPANLFDYSAENDPNMFGKFITAIQYSGAAVLDVNLTLDRFVPFTPSGVKHLFPYTEGGFTDRWADFVERYVHPDDRLKLLRYFSSKSIIAFFYRGDGAIRHNFRAKTTPYSSEVEEWAHYSAEAFRTEGSGAEPRCLIFIKDIREKKSLSYEAKEARTVLDTSAKALRAFVCELDILNNRIKTITQGGKASFSLKNGPAFEQLLLMTERRVHADDRARMRHSFGKSFIASFLESNDKTYSIAYRELTSTDNYEWREIVLAKQKDSEACFSSFKTLLESEMRRLNRLKRKPRCSASPKRCFKPWFSLTTKPIPSR